MAVVAADTDTATAKGVSTATNGVVWRLDGGGAGGLSTSLGCGECVTLSLGTHAPFHDGFGFGGGSGGGGGGGGGNGSSGWLRGLPEQLGLTLRSHHPGSAEDQATLITSLPDPTLLNRVRRNMGPFWEMAIAASGRAHGEVVGGQGGGSGSGVRGGASSSMPLLAYKTSARTASTASTANTANTATSTASTASTSTGTKHANGQVGDKGMLRWSEVVQAWVSVTSSRAGYGAAVRRIVVVGEVSRLRIAVNGEPIHHPALAR